MTATINRTTVALLGAAIIGQVLVLSGMYVKAALPLWNGEEIRVKTIPVDPRSLFRGNYARLRYDFNRVDSNHFDTDEPLRKGEVVYLLLEKSPDDLYVFAGASLEQPTGKMALRGRVTGIHYRSSSNTEEENDNRIIEYEINYGIDAYFAPKEKALALEKELRDGGVAVLMVADDGRARLKSIDSQIMSHK